MTAVLTISSKNYSSRSLRGWLLCRMSGIDFEEKVVDENDADSRRELLLMSPSFLVPRLTHNGATIWATLAIAEYLNEIAPDAGLLPSDFIQRGHCRSIAGEMNSGFSNLRSALPMNIRARHENFPVFTGAKPDIERIKVIWEKCLERSGGPFLFGTPTVADVMFAPVCTRFRTYGIPLPDFAQSYSDEILDWRPMRDWIKGAEEEPNHIPELEVEF